jgi:PEP-CTERM motif
LRDVRSIEIIEGFNMIRAILSLMLVAALANSSFAAFSFTLKGANGPGVINGLGTVAVGGAGGSYQVLASSNVGGGELLSAYSLTLAVGNPNFNFAPATGSPNLNVTTNTLVGTFAFGHTGVNQESTSLFFSGPSTANGAVVFQFGSTNLNAVPEPSSLALVGLVGVGISMVRRRRS